MLQSNTVEAVVAGGSIVFLGLIAMVIIGMIIITVLGTLFMLIPAIIVSGIVWWLTGSELLTGVAFLLIALSSFLKKK